MKVAIVGATVRWADDAQSFLSLSYLSFRFDQGNTGLQLVAQALQRKHQVTAIVRNTDKLASFGNDKNFKVSSCKHCRGHWRTKWSVYVVLDLLRRSRLIFSTPMSWPNTSQAKIACCQVLEFQVSSSSRSLCIRTPFSRSSRPWERPILSVLFAWLHSTPNVSAMATLNLAR